RLEQWLQIFRIRREPRQVFVYRRRFAQGSAQPEFSIDQVESSIEVLLEVRIGGKIALDRNSFTGFPTATLIGAYGCSGYRIRVSASDTLGRHISSRQSRSSWRWV